MLFHAKPLLIFGFSLLLKSRFVVNNQVSKETKFFYFEGRLLQKNSENIKLKKRRIICNNIKNSWIYLYLLTVKVIYRVREVT